MSKGGRSFAYGQPFLVVRAHVDEAVRSQFHAWYCATHRPNMLAIPGITAAYAIRRTDGPLNWQTLFEFAPGSEIQAALQSPQAQKAREDWATWADHVRDLSVEVYAALGALPAFQHWN